MAHEMFAKNPIVGPIYAFTLLLFLFLSLFVGRNEIQEKSRELKKGAAASVGILWFNYVGDWIRERVPVTNEGVSESEREPQSQQYWEK